MLSRTVRRVRIRPLTIEAAFPGGIPGTSFFSGCSGVPVWQGARERARRAGNLCFGANAGRAFRARGRPLYVCAPGVPGVVRFPALPRRAL